METIKRDALSDGDVILYHGTGLISRAIRLFDGTEVNHAAVYLGGQRVGEALGKGLTERSFDDSVADDEYVIARRLLSHPGVMDPVLAKSKQYLAIGNRYGFEQIVLLVLLGLTRKVPANKYLKWLLRKALDEASALLMKKGKQQPMICSEYVYRCYDEALPASNDPYCLEINPFPFDTTRDTASLRAPAARPHRGRMHRDSLLAWAEDTMTLKGRRGENAVVRSFEQPAVKRKTAVSKEDKAMAAMSLQELIDGYLKETKKPVMRSTYNWEADLRSPEILAGIKKFAEAHQQATIKQAGRRSESWAERSVDGVVPDALGHLLKTVADFVTPGDLLNCRSLYNVGRIDT